MLKTVKELLKENINLVDKGNYTLLYSKILKESSELPVVLTNTLLSLDINPLEYMDKIPIEFYSNQNNQKENCIKIPHRITNMGTSAFEGTTPLTLIYDGTKDEFNHITNKQLAINNGARIVCKDGEFIYGESRL